MYWRGLVVTALTLLVAMLLTLSPARAVPLAASAALRGAQD